MNVTSSDKRATSAAEGRKPNPAESESAGVGVARPAEPPTEDDAWTYSEEKVTGGLHIGPCESCSRLREQLDAALALQLPTVRGLFWKLQDAITALRDIAENGDGHNGEFTRNRAEGEPESWAARRARAALGVVGPPPEDSNA